jgi:uncharacterized protein (DUF427 family)
MCPKPIKPESGQESVWDYPRPPRLERTTKHLEIVMNGVKIADTTRAYRVLETSHPPVYYLPLEDIKAGVLEPSSNSSFCEWKGGAGYYTVRVSDAVARDAAWFYPNPTPGFAAIKDYVAFYAGRMQVKNGDGCFVDGERVTPQPGGFYGGWITRDVSGPFKGIPGSAGW